MGINGRRPDNLRPVNFILNAAVFAKPSVLFTLGNSRVSGTVTFEDGMTRKAQNSGLAHNQITKECALMSQQFALEGDYAGIG